MKHNQQIAEISLTENLIVENQEVAPGVYVLSVERPFDFIPGQVVALTSSKTIPPRMYSVCSGKHDKLLQILYNVKPQGLLTTQLARLQSRDKIYLSPPSGSFYPKLQNSWWIASGTGIAPFISQVLSENVQNVHLIHGARSLDGFYFQKLLENKAGVEYVRCCSGEAHPHIYSGRLTKYLKENTELPLDDMFFLCGSPEMVVDTRDLLIAKGIEFSKIGSEIYF
jgi:ferredoxin/flavodoxin---NADP+ reductase